MQAASGSLPGSNGSEGIGARLWQAAQGRANPHTPTPTPPSPAVLRMQHWGSAQPPTLGRRGGGGGGTRARGLVHQYSATLSELVLKVPGSVCCTTRITQYKARDACCVLTIDPLQVAPWGTRTHEGGADHASQAFSEPVGGLKIKKQSISDIRILGCRGSELLTQNMPQLLPWEPPQAPNGQMG